jgi:hypothetical protein
MKLDCHIRLRLMSRGFVNCALGGVIVRKLGSNSCDRRRRRSHSSGIRRAAISWSEPGAARNGQLPEFRERPAQFPRHSSRHSGEIGGERDENAASGHL